MRREKSWADFKALVIAKGLFMQYDTSSHDGNDYYNLWAKDGDDEFVCSIVNDDPANSDQEDFETNYQDTCNKPLSSYSQEGKPNVIASSRPNGTETYFTTVGDHWVNQTIGDGKRMEWDFSNSDDEVSAPTGFKRKRIDVVFIDSIWIKEGSLYFHNAPKGCYGDCYVVCPTDGWYYDNAGNLVQAAEPTIILHYVNRHPIQGSVPMGDELNTEETQINPILPGYTLRIEITTPDSDTTSNGVVEFETFRVRTVIL
jgi:hypothetical protein